MAEKNEKAIKAIAVVAAAAYRKVFEVNPDYSTGQLLDMDTALALLDKQPTPVPEPPKFRVNGLPFPPDSSNSTIWHDPEASQPESTLPAAAAEKLASSPETVMQFVDALNKRHMFICHPDGTFLENEELIAELPKAFPTLSQGRLTRDNPRVGKAVEKHYAVATETLWKMVDDLLTLQSPMRVSREQWINLPIYGEDRIKVKVWLKYIGMEIEE